MTNKQDVISNQLPFIDRLEEEITPNGHTLKRKRLTVQGKSLAECKKVFNEEWKKG